ncbi:hypothetical protein F751_2240 [Auxenochlorella protothecoides]|uniref:Sfi1 spindle body domain-containing protein n=1 Tax=Auxenochlorella protothecoides TaxID=3075 RepID=A0A087SLP9_AUXPR|nr:hypothetical protein F751_2240 [Auxenochlorella protothecoides]KFM26653.1 hypothetical protein F751_2240 [Auxenochlorella protothecoides]
MSQGSTGSGHPPRPPYLPAFRSAPASRQTSRASSPRSTYSQALACHKAAPRAFKPDASPRPGLSTGDAVALQCDDGDRFFRVHAASTSVGEALGQGPALLRPCGRCGPADAHTHLEVVLSGEWLGLRSAAAGDRFLQARKHGAARLAFHSANLGTWEQWQLGPGAAEALAQPWETSQPLVLQHRRLPQVQLHVTLVRVGTFLPLSVGGSTTPRSLAPVPEAGMAGLEREKLRRISDVVVQEWFAYVDREKALRSEAEGRLADLTQTTAHLRAWAVEKVESLRSQVELDVAELLEAVRARSRELAGSQAAVEATRGAALAALAARRRRDACAAAFAAWRAATAAENRRRAWEAAAARRRVARLMGLAVDAWRLACEDAAHTKQLLRRAVEKLSAMRLRQAFRAWAGAVELRREQQALLRRAVAQSVARRQAAAFSSWRAWVEERQEAAAKLEHLIALSRARRALGAWRRCVADSASLEVEAAAHAARSRAQLALRAWRAETQQAATRRSRLVQLVEGRARALQHAALAAWRDHTKGLRLACATVARCLEGRAASLQAAASQAACLAVWREWMVGRRRERALMALALARADRQRAHGVLQALASNAEAARSERAMARQADRFGRRVLVGKALGAWLGARDARAALAATLARVGLRRQAVLESEVLAAWRGWVGEVRAERGTVALVQAWQRRRRAALVWQAWREAHAAGRLAEDRAEALAAQVRANTAREALLGWHAWVAAQRAQRAKMMQAVMRVSDLRLCWAFGKWRARAAEKGLEQERLQRAKRCLHRQQCARVLGAWRGAADRAVRQRLGVAEMVEGARRRSLAAILDGWRQAAEARDRLRRCLLQKQTAFRLFRTWYWDAFDDDLQDTLRTIFELTEGSIADPLPSRPASPDAGRGVGGVGRRATGAEAGSPPHAAAPGLVGMPLAQQRRLTASVTRSLAAAGLAGASPGRGASPLPDIRARIDAAAAAGVASAARAWPGRGIAAARPAGEETAGDQQGAREGPTSKNELQSWVEEGPEGAIRAGWRSGEAAPTPPLPVRGAYAGPAPGSWDPIPARSTAAALSAAPTPQPGPMPRDSAARRALALARTPLSAATPGGRWDGGPNERGASLSRQLAEAMEGEGAGGRTPLSAAKTPPGGYAGAGHGKENAALGYSPAWYQSMSPSQQYTADYLAAAATPSPPRAQDSGGSGPLGATPPLMHNPLSFAF